MHTTVTATDLRQSRQDGFMCIVVAYQEGLDRCCAVKHQLPLDRTLKPEINNGKTLELKLYHMKQTQCLCKEAWTWFE